MKHFRALVLIEKARQRFQADQFLRGRPQCQKDFGGAGNRDRGRLGQCDTF